MKIKIKIYKKKQNSTSHKINTFRILENLNLPLTLTRGINTPPPKKNNNNTTKINNKKLSLKFYKNKIVLKIQRACMKDKNFKTKIKNK